MTNEKLIRDAVSLVASYYEAEGIVVSNSHIEIDVRKWYNNSEITEKKMLAAAVLEYGSYVSRVDWDKLKALRDFYFPEETLQGTGFRSIDELLEEQRYLESKMFSIGEIEAAQKDFMWW